MGDFSKKSRLEEFARARSVRVLSARAAVVRGAAVMPAVAGFFFLFVLFERFGL